MDEIVLFKGSVFICFICEKWSIVGVMVNLVRDYNYDIGCGREWICDSCNIGFGRFKDNLKFLEKVIEYLKKYEK